METKTVPGAPVTNGASTVICATELRKCYDDRVALDDVSLSVARGEIVALLGPNGAGKTTTLSIISGVITPDTGSVSINGHDLSTAKRKARDSLGLVPQSLALYPTLTAIENLMFFGRIQGLSSRRAKEASLRLLGEVGLSDRADDIVDGFSGGMKRRLNIACGMLHSPAAIMLDEPTVGVDPQSRERIFTVVEAASARGAAILYSTHYMEEAERLCNRIILIDHGNIVARGTATELIALAGTETRLEVTTRRALAPGWCAEVAGVSELPWEVAEGFAVALSVASIDHVPELIRLAGEMGNEVIEFHVHRPNLQDAFLKLTGHALRDAPA